MILLIRLQSFGESDCLAEGHVFRILCLILESGNVRGEDFCLLLDNTKFTLKKVNMGI